MRTNKYDKYRSLACIDYLINQMTFLDANVIIKIMFLTSHLHLSRHKTVNRFVTISEWACHTTKENWHYYSRAINFITRQCYFPLAGNILPLGLFVREANCCERGTTIRGNNISSFARSDSTNRSRGITLKALKIDVDARSMKIASAEIAADIKKPFCLVDSNKINSN